jgi:hypothetical protein
MFTPLGSGNKVYFSPFASTGVTAANGAEDDGDRVLKSGKTFLSLAEMKSICGGVHPYEYASANGVGLDGGGKSVYAVEFPASSKLTGKWAVKVWDGDPVDSKERLENELVARVVAKHRCAHQDLIFTEAYGGDDGKGSYIIASRFLDGFKDVDGELRQSADLRLRAELFAFGEIAPLDQFHMNGMKCKADTSSTKFGLYDLEPFTWKLDSTKDVSEPGVLNMNKAICTFAKKKNDPQFDSALQSAVSGWQGKINNPSFRGLLSEEIQNKVGLSGADADQVVRVLHRRTSVFAKHVGLAP